MKHFLRFITFIIACSLIVFCVSCKGKNVIDTQPHVVNEQNIGNNTNKNSIIESVRLFETEGFLFPEMNIQSKKGFSLSFFGTVSGELFIRDVSEVFLQKYVSITCLTDDGIEYIPDNYSLFFSNVPETNNMNVRIDLHFSKEDRIIESNIKQINLLDQNGESTSYLIGNYRVKGVKYAEPQQAFCFESPLQASKEMNFPYYIAIPTEHNSDEIDFDITVSDSPAIIDATIVSWEFDSKLTEELKQHYSVTKTPKELQYFKVYKLNVGMIFMKPSTVIQPYISVTNGTEIYNCKTDPFIIHLKQ